MPARDPIGYGWDAIVKGEIIDEISEEEAYQMLPRTVEEPKSIICSISNEEYEFTLPTPQMRENACQDREVSEKIVKQHLTEHENALEGVT